MRRNLASWFTGSKNVGQTFVEAHRHIGTTVAPCFVLVHLQIPHIHRFLALLLVNATASGISLQFNLCTHQTQLPC